MGEFSSDSSRFWTKSHHLDTASWIMKTRRIHEARTAFPLKAGGGRGQYPCHYSCRSPSRSITAGGDEWWSLAADPGKRAAQPHARWEMRPWERISGTHGDYAGFKESLVLFCRVCVRIIGTP